MRCSCCATSDCADQVGSGLPAKSESAYHQARSGGTSGNPVTMTSQHASSIDRRLFLDAFLGAAGTVTVLGQPVLAQDAKSEAKPEATGKRLSDTIADFVVDL